MGEAMIGKKEILSFLVGVIVTAAVFSVIFHIGSGGVSVPEVNINTFDQKVKKILSDGTKKASLLNEKGEKLNAAILLAELAATEQVLIFKKDNTNQLPEPSILETLALQQFFLIDRKEFKGYEEFLKFKYPDSYEANKVTPSVFESSVIK